MMGGALRMAQEPCESWPNPGKREEEAGGRGRGRKEAGEGKAG
eukprot:CAMPEP_0117682040 /NCGR_PEP_ID=MMETSP0804-20121206/19382_1 /TAXON_ID=1074897 /ORGANISM="Tetraselmis astigmatica, Strain CCMP880" /LENGTH=42 /DNA_ID= /DNA_START= /DNA_END= /DNA_ORIENTATION=